WIEPTTCNTAATKIWTKVPSISTSGDTVYLYYGNSAVTSTSDKTDTLLSWTQTTNDDFNGGVATDVVISSDSVEIDIKSVADGEWYVINDDLVVVGTATGYLMWPRQNSLGTNNNATKQWKIEDTVGAPSWNSSTYVYDYMAGSCVSACQKASYPAFSWAEDLDYQGYTDWRMPTASELQQLWYDGVTYISYINSYYWSADVRNSDTAFHVRFGNGLVYNDLKTTYRLLRAVRLGDGPYITSDSNLISSSNDTATNSDFNNISWNGITPAGTTIKYQIATNNDNATWTFIGPDGTNATYYTTQEESIHSSHQGDRYIKYKAYLETTDITVTPTLNDITVFYAKYSASVSVGSPGSEERGPGPVAFWKFDEGFGQTANDSTINANNGT
ncbi:MAG: DUF2341 domain-containing protein, partial [Candidatus Pacebacteria bacterium]|nr:DUF2341 domain-containing protein [Candidatus Paceibacterota bacterium]